MKSVVARRLMQSMGRVMAAYFSDGAVSVYPPHHPQRMPPLHRQQPATDGMLSHSYAHMFLSLCCLQSRYRRLYVLHTFCHSFRPSIRACMHLRLYVSTISSVSLDRFLPDFCHLVHLGTKMNWVGWGVKRSRSHYRGGGVQYLTLTLSSAFQF